MPNKKRVHLQQFGIIHLPNTDLTYIRNSERNKKFLFPFRNHSLFFISFFHPPTYARGEVSFAKFLFLPSWFAKLKAIFLVLPKSYGCQVDLPSCRSCSESSLPTATEMATTLGSCWGQGPVNGKKTEGAVRKRRRLPEVILWLKVILFSNI
jgi:hypothetical protein